MKEILIVAAIIFSGCSTPTKNACKNGSALYLDSAINSGKEVYTPNNVITLPDTSFVVKPDIIYGYGLGDAPNYIGDFCFYTYDTSVNKIIIIPSVGNARIDTAKNKKKTIVKLLR